MNPPLLLGYFPVPSTAFRPKTSLILTLFLATLAAFLSSIARAQLYTETSTLFGDLNTAEYFGYTVAASGDTLVAGTSSNKRVYVFIRSDSSWVLQQKLTVNYSDFSYGEVAVDGDTLFAGGVVYVRSGGSWTVQQAFPLTDPRGAIRGDTLIIGNPYEASLPRNNDGSVLVYTRDGTTWTQQAQLLPAAPGQQEELGTSLAFDGNTVIAGINNGPGGAYVFVRDGTTWTRQARLVLPSGSGWMRVALEGDTAAVSDPANNHIYIFTRSGTQWSITQTLMMPPTGGGSFGDELSLSGGILAAGAEGTYFLYSQTPTGWILGESFSRGTFFGNATLANRGKLFVWGDPFDNTQAYAGGIVKTFSVPPPPAPGGGWQDLDIGAVGIAGNTTISGAEIAVRGSGADIWENADQFHFRTESLTGDGAIIAQVKSTGSGHPWAKIGLMFREDIAPASRTVMAFVTPGSHLGTQTRLATADTTRFQDAGWRDAPIWLMLARSGNLFASYRSDDGNTWTPIGSSTVNMPPTIHVGLAVSSHDNTTLATGIFSDVEIVGLPPPGELNAPTHLTGSLVNGTSIRLQWTDNTNDETGFNVERSLGSGSGSFTVIVSTGSNVVEYTDSNLMANTTYTYRVRAVRDSDFSEPSNTFTLTTTTTPPQTLIGQDIGEVVVPGSYTNSNGIVTINAAGSDIWEQADNGYFVHREITGDFDIRARVTSLTNTHPWAKAGIMVRESLAPGARNVFTLLTADNVAGLQVRDTFNASTSFTGGPWVNAPYWVRLVRTGSTFQSLISENGTTWQILGTRSLPLPATLRAGLAVSSHVPDTTTQATVTSLQFGN